MDDHDIIQRLTLLRQEHRELDAEIAGLLFGPGQDQLRMARLKKRKLTLKDEIEKLLDRLVPNIIA